MPVIPAPRPDGPTIRHTFVYFSGIRTVAIIAPDCEGLDVAIRVAMPTTPTPPGLYIVAFAWIEKHTFGRPEEVMRGWFPALSWRRPTIRELADLADGSWSPEEG